MSDHIYRYVVIDLMKNNGEDKDNISKQADALITSNSESDDEF